MVNAAELRNAVIAEARTWIGTPYRLNGEEKGVGVDCHRLVVACYRAAGFLRNLELPTYASWSEALEEHRRENGGIARLRESMEEIAAPSLGDAALFTLCGVFIHLAIVIRWPGEVLHTMRVVSINDFTGRERGRVKFLTPKAWS